MNFPSQETVAAMRTQYPMGTRVELVQMDDPHTRLRPGDRGRVTSVDDTGTVHISWDRGSTLGAVFGVDVIRRLPEQEVQCLECGNMFNGVPELDTVGWYCVCPECGGSFDVEKDNCLYCDHRNAMAQMASSDAEAGVT